MQKLEEKTGIHSHEQTEAEIRFIFDQVQALLKKVGIDLHVSQITYAVQAHGYRYTEERYPQGGCVINNESVLGVIYYMHPEAKNFVKAKKRNLDKVVNLIVQAGVLVITLPNGFRFSSTKI